MSDAQRFYDDLAPEYEAIFVDWDKGMRWQGELIAGLLGPAPDPVLDVAAGMGTQALGLALRGLKVRARDLSPALVERGRRQAERLGVAVAFEVADMRVAQAADAGRYGTVIGFDNALVHLLTDRELGAALGAARQALRPGGRFLTSLRDYDALVTDRPALDPPRLLGSAPARRLVLQVWTWAPDGKSYQLDHIVLREAPGGWQGHTRRTTCRALLRAELEQAARAAGFTSLEWIPPERSGYYQPIFVAGLA
ncbi:MAG TPA: class I SAM-dependent methyltransferase [Polyangia bacterium]|nr:class I SAM-dependent methyltransferase [Polyangia bacterium]